MIFHLRELTVEEDENIDGLEVESAEYESIEDQGEEDSHDAVELIDDDPIDQLAVSEEISEIFLKPLTGDLTNASTGGLPNASTGDLTNASSLGSHENLAGEEVDEDVSENLSAGGQD